jgi:hypothetical protein
MWTKPPMLAKSTTTSTSPGMKMSLVIRMPLRAQAIISIGGNVSGGNVNIGGSQTFHGAVNIQYSALSSAPAGSPLEELKGLLQELETVLQQTVLRMSNWFSYAPTTLLRKPARTIRERRSSKSLVKTRRNR